MGARAGPIGACILYPETFRCLCLAYLAPGFLGRFLCDNNAGAILFLVA